MTRRRLPAGAYASTTAAGVSDIRRPGQRRRALSRPLRRRTAGRGRASVPLQFPRRPLAVERFIARPGFRETRTYRILFADGSSSYGLVALSEAWHAGHRRRAGPEVRILGAAQTGVGGGRTTSGHPGPRRCYLHRWPTGRASPPSWPRSSRQCQAQGTPGMTNIDKVAWIRLENGAILSSRSRSKGIYYILGGKQEIGGGNIDTLVREIQEEPSLPTRPSTSEPSTPKPTAIPMGRWSA